MSPEVKAEEHLVGHYSALGDLKSDFRNHNLFDLVTSLVTGNKVLDIGCGSGLLLSILATQDKDVTGIEPNDGLRVLATQTNPDLTILPGLAEDVDLLVKEPVDTVLMIDVLEHIKKDIEQIKKIRSILKIGGEFVFVVPAHPFLYGKRDGQMGHYRRYSKKTLQNILTTNGFCLRSLRHWNALGFLPYLISEKIFHRPLESKLRRKVEPRGLAVMAQQGLNLWFNWIENNFDFGFGLSIIGIAKKES